MKHTKTIFLLLAFTMPAFSQTYVNKGAYISSNGADLVDTYVRRTSGSESYLVNITNSGSYTGTNIILTNTWEATSYSYGLNVSGGKFVNISAAEGTWSEIHAQQTISLSGMEETSYLTNTRLYTGGSSGANRSLQTGSDLVLDNVEIIQTTPDQSFYGIDAKDAALVTNNGKRAVTISLQDSENIYFALSATSSAVIDLHDSTINVGKIATGSDGSSGIGYGVLVASGLGTINLTNSTLSSREGNTLITSGMTNSTTTPGTVTLDNVNLENAKNQRIFAEMMSSYIIVNLTNGTAFDGFSSVTSFGNGNGIIDVNITSGASWNVTQDSTLGTGTLTLDGSSTISFITTDGDFTNINAATIMLEKNSILQLDQDLSYFKPGDLITLFTGAEGDYFTNEGTLLMTADGYSLTYIDHDNGTFEIPSLAIPEPATATLGLLGLGALTLGRRRKS